MASSSLFTGAALILIAASASGCRIEAHTQTSFEDDKQPAKVSVSDWAGQPITIQNDGINPLSGTGGVEVKIDPAATKITATATFAALADDDKESEARLNITDAIATMAIVESPTGITVKCNHGNGHGTSGVAGSGCKILRVTLPPGTALQPHNLTVGNGNGSIRVGLADAGGVPFVKNLLVDNNGLGAVSIRATPVKDASLTITGEHEVAVALPTTFSARSVQFAVDETDTAKALARVITSGFTGMASGSAYPTAGATADAAALLSVTSKGPFDDDTITVTSF